MTIKKEDYFLNLKNVIFDDKKLLIRIIEHIIYNHTPYIRAHKLRIKPIIQKSFTISFSRHPSLSK